MIPGIFFFFTVEHGCDAIPSLVQPEVGCWLDNCKYLTSAKQSAIVYIFELKSDLEVLASEYEAVLVIINIAPFYVGFLFKKLLK